MRFLFWITSALLVSLGFTAGIKESHITCVCTTDHCQQQEMRVCTTEGLCFTQYLDRGTGSETLLRGCIGGRTPLLCENRRPSTAKTWPLLHCCNTDLCNRGTVPTPPPWQEEMRSDTNAFKNLHISSFVSNHSDEEAQQLAPVSPESPESSLLSPPVQKSLWPHIVSPVYVSVLVLGVVSLFVICIVAATVIRKSNRFYSDRYGELGFQPGFLKPTHMHCDCDSEVESVRSSQPYLHVACSGRDANT